MAVNPSTASAMASALYEEWAPGFEEAPNEEARVTRAFMDGTKGATKMGNQLHIVKIEAPGYSNVQTMSTSSGATTAALSYYVAAPTEVTVDPIYYYIGMEFPPNVLTRVHNGGSAVRAAYRRMLSKALAWKKDTLGAQQAQYLSHVVGGAQNLDQSLFAAAIQALTTYALDEYEPGKTQAYLTITPTQVAALLQIPAFTHADIIGDGSNPLSRGWFSKVYNTNVQESGNVYVSGGIAHNMLYLPRAEVVAYGEQPHLWEPVRDGLSYLEFATMECGFKELFDEFAVDVKTNG